MNENANMVGHDDYAMRHPFRGYHFGEQTPGRTGNSCNPDDVNKFTGQERDHSTDLMYFGARYYDPSIGRWLSVDPATRDLNPYIYTGNNPINRVDRNGLWWVEAHDNYNTWGYLDGSFFTINFDSRVEMAHHVVLATAIPGYKSWLLKERNKYVSTSDVLYDFVGGLALRNLPLPKWLSKSKTILDGIFNLDLMDLVDDPEFIKLYIRRYGGKKI